MLDGRPPDSGLPPPWVAWRPPPLVPCPWAPGRLAIHGARCPGRCPGLVRLGSFWPLKAAPSPAWPPAPLLLVPVCLPSPALPPSFPSPPFLPPCLSPCGFSSFLVSLSLRTPSPGRWVSPPLARGRGSLAPQESLLVPKWGGRSPPRGPHMALGWGGRNTQKPLTQPLPWVPESRHGWAWCPPAPPLANAQGEPSPLFPWLGSGP